MREHGQSAGFDDSIGHMYDGETAVHFAHVTTGVGEAVVRAVLDARELYLLGLGIIAPEDAWDGHDPTEIRAAAPELFPAANRAARYVAIGLEGRFVIRSTGVDAEIVRAVLRADDEYMRRLGIMD